jgi:2-keto-3-deoxy-L-rhamnonate aldolase RhmA
VCGVLLDINSPEVVELFGYLGYDFVFIDCQHGGLTVETARHLMRAAELTGLTSLVRVPRNDPSVILEFLDCGAGGIIVPNITTRAETEQAAAAMRYPPVGIRGAFGRSRAAAFGVTQSAAEYFTRANDEVLFVGLIEDQAALGNLTEICSTPGLDVVLIGPSDLALSMGVVGGWSEPEVQEQVERIRAAGAVAGKPTMVVALDPADGRRLYAQGFQALLVSAIALLTRAASGFLRELNAD